jgi:hypothetical protein
MGLVLRQRHLPKLSQEVLFTFGYKQYLVLAEITQLARRFASTNPALMATLASEEALQVQIIRRQARNIITRQ